MPTFTDEPGRFNNEQREQASWRNLSATDVAQMTRFDAPYKEVIKVWPPGRD